MTFEADPRSAPTGPGEAGRNEAGRNEAGRSRELADNLAAVQDRITGALRRFGAGGDNAAAPSLIVVTKFFPSADVILLRDLGVTDVGENRDQEAAAKAADVAAALGSAGARLHEPSGGLLRWHFIGQLQSNKAKSVVKYAHAVHSVDRPALVSALAKAMTTEQLRRSEAGQPARPPLQCFIQVDLGAGTEPSGETVGRGGADRGDVERIADLLAAADQLEPAGVMAVAPLGAEPGPAFEQLLDISVQLREHHPAAWRISAGMSHDLEEAIEYGATHLRVGSDVLGPRPSLR